VSSQGTLASPVLRTFVSRLEAGWLSGHVGWDTVLRVDELKDAAAVGGDRGLDAIRAWMCADWLVRVRVPAWLALAGLHRRARAIRRLEPMRDARGAQRAAPVLAAARDSCAPTRERKAAWDALWSGRCEMATAHAGAAARRVASVPIWLAVREAASFAAWDEARDAIGDTVWDASWAVAWDAAWEAGEDGAREAAVAALAPTALALERQAMALLEDLVGLDEAIAAP
jgi:hypothetical protein